MVFCINWIKKVVQWAHVHVHVQRAQSDCIIRCISLYAYMCRCITQQVSISSAEHGLIAGATYCAATCCYLGTFLCMYFKGQKLKSRINTICFITRLDYMLGTGWSSAFLHCCEHFVSVTLRSSLTTQHWNRLQAAVVNNLYCKSHDFVVSKTAMESFAQCLQHDHTSKQDRSGSIQFELTCSVNADHSSLNRPRLGRQSLVV